MLTEGAVQRTRQELLHDLESSQAQVVRLLESMSAAQDWQPEAAEWSFRLIAEHLAALEETWHLRRVTAIAAGNTPQIAHYSHHADDLGARDLGASLERWIDARRRLLDFVATLDDAELDQVGVHEIVGPMTILETLAEILEQDQVNLRHIHQLIVAYYETTAAPQSIRGEPSLLPGMRVRGSQSAGAFYAANAANHNEAQ